VDLVLLDDYLNNSVDDIGAAKIDLKDLSHLFPAEISNMFRHENDAIINDLSCGNQYFSTYYLENSYKDSLGVWENEYNEMLNMQHLACIFPQKVILNVGLKSGCNLSKDEVGVGVYSLKSVLNNHRDLIERGILRLYFKNIVPSNISSRKAESLLSKTTIDDELMNSIQMKLPWLYGARTEDYIELIEKYQLQFQNFKNYIDRLSNVAKTKEELTSLLVQEYKEVVTDLQIALEKKKHDLKIRGLQTLIGSIFTAIPFIIPYTGLDISPELLSSILGAATLKGEMLPLIKEIGQLKFIGSDNKLFVLWKWGELV